MSGSVVPLGRGGDHVAYLVDDRLVVRFAGDRDDVSAAAAVEREARVLEYVAELSPLPVPRVELAAPEEGCLAYELLPGVPLLEIAPRSRALRAAAVAESLGRLLRVLHAVPHAVAASLVDVDDFAMEAWLAEAAEHHARARAAIPALHREPVEAFLAAPPPPPSEHAAFTHNDLGIEHVLVDPRSLEVTGVIDWSDAALADPARDFGLLLRDLGRVGLDAALAAYGSRDDTALRDRAGFYARTALLEDLVFGLETGRPEYVEKSVAGLAWLFPPADGTGA